jgi:hypothetical protein
VAVGVIGVMVTPPESDMPPSHAAPASTSNARPTRALRAWRMVGACRKRGMEPIVWGGGRRGHAAR